MGRRGRWVPTHPLPAVWQLSGTPRLRSLHKSIPIKQRMNSPVYRRIYSSRSSAGDVSSPYHCHCRCCPHNNLIFSHLWPHSRPQVTSLRGLSRTTHTPLIKNNYIIQNLRKINILRALSRWRCPANAMTIVTIRRDWKQNNREARSPHLAAMPWTQWIAPGQHMRSIVPVAGGRSQCLLILRYRIFVPSVPSVDGITYSQKRIRRTGTYIPKGGHLTLITIYLHCEYSVGT